jgi:uncharacterized protein YodC (DUF2158 family)
MSGTIKPGDVVVPISGGPRMTVERLSHRVEESGDFVHVVWFDQERHAQTAILKAEGLKVIQPPYPPLERCQFCGCPPPQSEIW